MKTKPLLLKVLCASSIVGISACSDTNIIEERSVRPEAEFTAPTEVLLNEDFELDASASYDAGGDLVNYYWNDASGSQIIKRSFDTAGEKTITLVVEDEQGLRSNPFTKTIVVVDDGSSNQAPIAKITGESSAKVGSELTFSAADSSDAEDAKLNKFYWNGSAQAGGATYTHSFDKVGTVNISLVVEDSQGLKSQSVVKTVIVSADNQAPVAKITGENSVELGLELTFSAADSSDAEDAKLNKFYWNGSSEAGSSTYTHLFDKAGTTTISLIVEDSDGLKSEKVEKQITVFAKENQAPVAKITGENSVELGSELTLSGSDSSDAEDGELSKFYWNGSSEAGSATYTHTFDEEGSVTVTLIVEDSEGKKSLADEFEVLVTPPIDSEKPIVNASPQPGKFTSAQKITLSATDNVDEASSLSIYYSLDGSTPSLDAQVYSGESIDVSKENSPLTITTLVVDKAGNQNLQSFSYTVADPIEPSELGYYSTNKDSIVGAYNSSMQVTDGTKIAEYSGCHPEGGGPLDEDFCYMGDAEFDDWDESSMLIAQGVAFDDAKSFRGHHETPSMDAYALYSAWDDDYLYIGIQNSYVNDILDPANMKGDSQWPAAHDMIMLLAFDTNAKAVDGLIGATGRNAWGGNTGAEPFFTFDKSMGVDTLFYFKSNPSNKTAFGTAIFYANEQETFVERPALAEGDTTTVLPTDLESSFLEEGVEYGLRSGSFASNIWCYTGGSDTSGVYEVGNYQDCGDHQRAWDMFWELKIPFSALRITKEQLEQQGIGVMYLATAGQSAVDSLPHDPSTQDNANQPYSFDESTSMEKNDYDAFTVPLARIGKM